jgi:hypothetical protein
MDPGPRFKLAFIGSHGVGKGSDPTANIANLRQVRSVVRGGMLRSLAELRTLATAKGK